MRYYVYFGLAILSLFYGVALSEDMSVPIFYGAGFMYLGTGLLCYSIVQLIRRKHGDI